jgi:protein-tyrosine phosphatase
MESLDDYEAWSGELLSRLARARVESDPVAGGGSQGRFSIAFVCAGNRFRSPLAEAVARRLLDGAPVVVTSCGHQATRGAPPLAAAVTAAERLGLDISTHASRRLTRLADCDLVIGFEAADVAAAVIEGGAPAERTFLLTEATELLADVPAELASGPELVRRLVSAREQDRGRIRRRGIPDPVAAPTRVQYDIAVEVVRLTEMLLAPLARRRPADAGSERALLAVHRSLGQTD